MHKLLISFPVIALYSSAYALSNSTELFIENSKSLPSSSYITGGGISGNEKMGLNCFTPSPGQMENCLSYYNDDPDLGIDPDITRLEVSVDLDKATENTIFKEFNGYPFIVKREWADNPQSGLCTMENPFIVTKYKNDSHGFQYPCTATGEFFDHEYIESNYWQSFSFNEANQAHFFAGLTLQMFYKYFNEIFPDSYNGQILEPQCNANADFCIKQLHQRVQADVRHNPGASWNYDSEHVEYNLGNSDYYSYTTMDVVSHEIGHAITHWNNPELGAERNLLLANMLEEAFSDVVSAAFKDYFEKNIIGSYRDGDFFKQQTQEKKWWLAWDMIWPGYEGEFDRGLRYFHWPSLDGSSINDAREPYQGAGNGYHLGGPIRKFYYLLTDKAGWQHSDALKLFILANKYCINPDTNFNKLGACLLSQVPRLFHSNNVNFNTIKNAQDLQLQIEKTLHTVGIFPENGTLNPLNVSLEKSLGSISYKIKKEFDLQSVDTLTIDWGNGNSNTWSSSDNLVALETLMNGRHSYNEDTVDATVSFHLSLNDNQTYYFAQDLHVFTKSCKPNILSYNQEIQSITLLGQPFTADVSGYTHIDASQITLTGNLDNALKTQGQTLNKHLFYYIDSNRNGGFEEGELVASKKALNGESITLSLSSLRDLSEGLIKLRVIVSDEEFIEACDGIHGATTDILLNIAEQDLPPSSEFTHEKIDKNTFIFSVKSEASNPKENIS